MIKFIYTAFIAAIQVGNSIYFGPCTIRQYCAILLFGYCLLNTHKLSKYSRLIPFYLGFIILYGVSCLFENSVTSFLRSFIGLYLVSIVGYFSTTLLVSNGNKLKYFCDSFILVGFINAIVTIFQYVGNPIALVAGSLFVNLEDPVKEAQFISMVNGNSQNMMGLMGDAVYNGYYSMILPFIVIQRFNKSNKLQWSLIVISLVSLFFVGERSCFGITFLLLMYYIFKKNKSNPTFYLFLVTVVLFLLYFSIEFYNSDVIQNSRFITHNDDARNRINDSIIGYIFSHLLVGGLQGFINLTGFPPHNVIASGFIYSGLVGGCLILYILFTQARVSLSLIRINCDLPIVLAFYAYTLNGFFHNPAIVTGDAMVWILWGMVYVNYLKNSKKNGISSNISNHTGVQCGEVSAQVR